MKDFFPESLGQKHGCAVYTAQYGSFRFCSYHVFAICFVPYSLRILTQTLHVAATHSREWGVAAMSEGTAPVDGHHSGLVFITPACTMVAPAERQPHCPKWVCGRSTRKPWSSVAGQEVPGFVFTPTGYISISRQPRPRHLTSPVSVSWSVGRDTNIYLCDAE